MVQSRRVQGAGSARTEGARRASGVGADGAAARTRTRQHRAGTAGRGAREGGRQPRGRRAGHEAPRAGMPTFAAAAARVLEQKRAGWRNTRHPASWLSSLERYAFPCIGSRPVSEVSSADGLEILTPIWHAKAQTARRVRQRIHAVMEWAVAMELRSGNPCDRIGPVLGPQKAPVAHMRAIPHQDVAAAIDAVRASGAASVVKLAFELLVLTATRSGEVRLAAWDEIDLGEMVWTSPALRMKAMREHPVPLSGRAVEILRAARTLGDGPLVFPGRRGEPLPEKRLRRLLQSQGIAAVPHGFRSSFRDCPQCHTRLSALGAIRFAQTGLRMSPTRSAVSASRGVSLAHRLPASGSRPARASWNDAAGAPPRPRARCGPRTAIRWTQFLSQAV